MKVQEKFENELKALESSIVGVFRAEPSLLDSQVARAVESMVNILKSRVKGKPLDAAINEILSLNSELSNNELLECLKVIGKSISKWTKQFGRQGYLNFVNQYF